MTDAPAPYDQDPATQRLLRFLEDPQSYPHRPSQLKLVQTHASWVLLVPPLVYKVKKPVNFGFLDYSTLALRHQDAEREVTLNRRLAPGLYLGVEPLCERDGELHFGPGGRVVEWAIKMRSMDARYFLKPMLLEGRAGRPEMDRIVERLAVFYESLPPLEEAEAAAATTRLREDMEGNFDAAERFKGKALPSPTLEVLRRHAGVFFAKHAGLLASRIQRGWIRDCHGDLHLEHIHLTPEALQIFDCITFNTRFRHIDVACDIAFLVMDLDFNGRADLAEHVTSRFAERMPDEDLPKLLGLYQCYRAAVRGKVECLQSEAATASEEERAGSLKRARQYFNLALGYALAGARAGVMVFMGNVASGKSTLAAAAGQMTGWRVWSSDRVRKELAGVPLGRRSSAAEREALYASAMTDRTYDTLLHRALEDLRNGRPVILDATFSRRKHRDALRAALEKEGWAVTWVEARAGMEATRERLARRAREQGVVSDARLEDMEALGRVYEPPEELPAGGKISVDTEAAPEMVLRDLLLALAELNASR